MSIRVWLGTSRIARKGLFTAQPIKKGCGLFSTLGKELLRQNPPNASTTVAHVGQDRSSRGNPNGDDHPFPVHHATVQVSYPLHPAIFVPE
jgi:hypothetical protein